MKKWLGLYLLIPCSMAAFSQGSTDLRKKEFNLNHGIALSGYDPVCYFNKNKAVKGSRDLALTVEGVSYYFMSTEDKEEFRKNPSKYEPQYGGWCAYAMGKDGDKVEVDPQTFKILNGKLFLFYNKFFNNTLTSWNKDEANLMKQADKNWIKYFH